MHTLSRVRTHRSVIYEVFFAFLEAWGWGAKTTSLEYNVVGAASSCLRVHCSVSNSGHQPLLSGHQQPTRGPGGVQSTQSQPVREHAQPPALS